MARILLRNFKYLPGKQFVRHATLPTTETAKKFRISLIQPESYESVINFMIKNFAKDPLTCAFGANDSSEFPNLIKCAWSEELKKGYSLQARTNDTNELAGVAINFDPYDAIEKIKRNELISECACDAAKNLLMAWEIIDRLSVLLPFYDKPNGVFEISGLAVDEHYGGMGLAKRLIVQSMCMGKCHGFKMARIDSTSDYSARAAQTVGFQTIYEKPFTHFNGIKSIEEPHTHVKVYARLLDGFLI